MTLVESTTPLRWGELDLPLFGLGCDHEGRPVEPAAFFCLAVDGESLWFLAGHGRPARLHAQARPGRFQAGLWEHDVAECFLLDPASGRYLELNLAPNGAWWSCEFLAPRRRADEYDIALPGVSTHADLAADGSWLAAMRLPLDVLRARIGFGAETRANVTMILESPRQRFLSACDLGGVLDFHQPARFLPLRRQAAGQSGD
jgi:hypothetical protein